MRRLRQCGLRHGLGDVAGFGHCHQHGLGAALGAVRVAARREPRRRLDETRKHGGLGDLHLAGGLAEIALRRGIDAVGAGAEIDAVEIKLEDLVLAEFPLQPDRQHHFLQLAPDRALLGQEQVLGELLGEGRAALRDAAMQHVGGHGAHEPDRIDAEMAVEAAVLDGDEGTRQIGRQVLESDGGAVHFAAGGKRLAVEADDLDAGRAFRDFDRLDRRQIGGDQRENAADRDHPPEADHQRPNRRYVEQRAALRVERLRRAAAGLRFSATSPASRAGSRRVSCFRRSVAISAAPQGPMPGCTVDSGDLRARLLTPAWRGIATRCGRPAAPSRGRCADLPRRALPSAIFSRIVSYVPEVR